MASKLKSALKKCTGFKKDAHIEPSLAIQLLGTSLCLMLSESAGMAQALYKIIPADDSKRVAEETAVKRLETAEVKAKERFTTFISSIMTNSNEREAVTSAFAEDIKSIAEQF